MTAKRGINLYLSFMKRRFLIVFGVATVIGLVSGSQSFISEMDESTGYTLGHAMVMQMPGIYLWAAFVPLIWYLVKHHRRSYLLHVVAAIAISIVYGAILIWFMHIIGHGYPSDHQFFAHLLVEIRYSGLVHLFTYIVIALALLGVQSYRELRDREVESSQLAEQLAQAQLQALRMQVHPHFLFNALNAVNMLIRADEKTRAVQAVTGLSELLRHVIDGEPLQEVRLEDEVAFLDRYLNIEAVRFGDRLRVHKSIAPDAQSALVPNLLLQPLVENSIRHGISEKRDAGRIEIIAQRENGRLLLRVEDDGVGIGASHEERVGLSNTRARLQKLYGANHELRLEQRAGGGTIATISIPYRT
jgi:two-component system, LytTR family, sensor kinase